MSGPYRITTAHDAEANVWYTVETNVPGLVVEAETFEQFVAEAVDLTPQLLELNHALPTDGSRRVALQVVRSETLELSG